MRKKYNWKAMCINESNATSFRKGQILTGQYFKMSFEDFCKCYSCNEFKLTKNITIEDIERMEGCKVEPIFQEFNAITPSHYNSTEISTFDVVDDWNLDFYLGTAIKYLQRAGNKDKSKHVEDLQKAIRYIEKEINLVKKNQESECE